MEKVVRWNIWASALTLALLASVLTGCNPTTAQAILGPGTYENGVYSNEFFGMSVPLPEDWHMQNQEQLAEQERMGNELLAGEDKKMQKTLKASKTNTATLYSLFRHAPGAPVLLNPNITCVAESVAHAPGITRGDDYYFHMKQLINASQVTYTFAEETYPTEIGGVEFDTLDSTMELGVVSIKQRMYAARMKDYMLMFVVIYATEEELGTLEEILKGHTFTKG